MDHNQMVELARDFARQKPFLKLASLFAPYRAKGFEKVRIGSDADGGYVMIDDFAGIELALSFGIDINVDWDLGIAARDIRVQQYDHTVAEAPEKHPLLSFYSKRIAAAGNDENSTSIGYILDQAGISEEASAILKIDIESDEWPVFDECDAAHLAKFSQILVEFHNFSYSVDHQWLRRATRVMQKINNNFFVSHVHANNWSPMAVVGNVYFPDTLEISFANRARYEPETSDELFPTFLDAPNNPLKPDLYLGAFRYGEIGR
ncbi:hypothetical protein [Methylobacterium gnaphalii]|uniref:Methyltransferase FkbM domain-containing protein n=1 Tax=Methylobacterium gnaphalii TaxID=1010610 RepID=A0A512JS70_9HYPH|nr:hypothetical protein [Methylobacterium gnaphalii]GEP12796.1 hypothetical protein MGN01_46410 [Methylobacterium gnaphalii]GJD69609.1 hypothetical protein MMMDOFMJ_2546 [Methylobacterium gnaphalii]GLS49533.1 hypothetical protein GCM10007885_23820 [Methylobacterium gnaphalii]